MLQALFEAKGDRFQAIDLLTERGYNTPATVDEAMPGRSLIDAWYSAAGSNRDRLVLLSSVGVVGRDEMPYPILNACGVLTAKASAEAAIKADAEQGGYAYTFVRPGQLFGGPYDNNVYLGTLFQLDKDADERDVLLGRGDVTLNDDPHARWKSTRRMPTRRFSWPKSIPTQVNDAAEVIARRPRPAARRIWTSLA